MALASLVVKIGADLSDLNKALSKTDQQIQRFGGKLQSAGKTMSAAVTLPLVGIGVAATKMASDAQEAANKFDVVMGPAAARVRERLEELRKTVPLARHEMEGLAAGIQDMLVPMGVARSAGADMSATMVELAGDLGSFNNVNPSQVLEAMQSALAGSSEPMRRFGVDTREAALEAVALSHGLIQAGEKMDMTTRAQAVLLAIQKDSTDAMGDAARTADSAANSFKFVTADMKDLGATLGQDILPLATTLAQSLSDWLTAFNELSPSTQGLIVKLGGVALVAGPLLSIIGGFLKILPALKLGFAALTGPIGLVIAAVAGLTFVWLKWGDDIKRIVSETVTAVREWLVNKFAAIVESVRQKIDAVKGFFQGMYQAVVGGSYVPDMIDGIAAEFARLDAVMVQPAVQAATAVETAFEAMMRRNQERMARVGEMTRNFTAAGGSLEKVTPRGSAPERVGGGEVKGDSIGTKVGQVIQAGGGVGQVGQIVQAVAAFGPLGALLPVVNGALETLRPVLDSLIEPLVEVGRTIGGILAPVLEMFAEPLRLIGELFTALAEPLRFSAYLLKTALAPGLKILSTVLRGVTIAFSYVMQALGWFVKALGQFIDKIIPDRISKAGKGLAEMGQSMIDNAKAARENTDATGDNTSATDSATDAVNKFAASLSNVPRVLNINALRNRISGGVGSGGGSGGGGLINNPGSIPGPTDMGGGNIYGDIYITVPGSLSPEATAEAVGRYLDRKASRGGTTRLQVSFQ